MNTCLKIVSGVFVLFGFIETIIGAGLAFILMANVFDNIMALLPLFVLIILGILSIVLNIRGIKKGGGILYRGLIIGTGGLFFFSGLLYYILNVMSFS